VIDEDPVLERRRLGTALLASIAMHALLVLLVVFVHRDHPLPKRQPPQSMDVVMLNPHMKDLTTPPKDAHTVSNHNAAGSSQNAKDDLTRAARSPMAGNQPPRRRPTPPTGPRTPPPMPEPAPQQRTRTLAMRDMREDNNAPPQPKPRKAAPRHPPLPKVPLADLMPSNMALAELSRDFERERRLKQMLNKTADIPINTRKARYAPYAHSLVQALENQWRPGQADYGNYTADDRRVLMRVTINGNGDLYGLEILRPSPIQQLNDSAVAAVHAAAPFRPLPSSWGLDRVSFYLTFEVVDDRFVFHAAY
jgi:TonB family protein